MSLEDLQTVAGLALDVIKIVAEVAALIAVIIKASQYIRDKRDKQLYDYVNSFADKERVRRLSGVNGLTNYASYMFQELFYICLLEKDPFIRERLRDALMDVSVRCKKQCKKIHLFIVQYCIKNDSLPIKDMDKQIRSRIIKFLTAGHTQLRIQAEIDRGSGNTYEADEEITAGIPLSSQLLANALTKAKLQNLSGMFLSDSSLYKAIWFKNTLERSVLSDVIGRHAKGICLYLQDDYIRNNDFYGSCLIGGEGKRVYIFNTEFRKSTFAFLKMSATLKEASKGESLVRKRDGATWEGDTFSQSKFFYAKIKQYSIKESKWNGCRLFWCVFQDTDFVKNEMHSFSCYYNSFCKVNFWSGKISGSFYRCRFEDVTWGGSDLKGTKFIRCVFQNVDFAGADLKNIVFENCRFIGNNNLKKDVHNADTIRISGKSAESVMKMIK